jgi:hypothetical protein
MAQNTALRDGPSGAPCSVLGCQYPNTHFLIQGDKCLASDLDLNRPDVLVERRIAEERDDITVLAVVFTLEVLRAER